MEIDQKEYERIGDMIHSDQSPVGIDAKKTHILIIHMLEEMNARISKIEKKLEAR